MKDFFISYTSADRTWAEWIAWVLEEQGNRVIIQAWDFRPGGNFILDMQRATAEAERTVMVLSDDYLQALYTQPEWAAAFKQDPTASDRKLLPIRVAPCQPTGMLAPLVYVDLVERSESEAEQLLLDALKERAKPATRPTFPQSVPESERVTPATVVFPGALQTLPFPRNLFFTGREDLLEAIHTALSRRGRVALSGLGGIGKTQIALEYAYRRQSDYEQVFWVRAEQKEELISGYVGLAKDLQIPGCQQEAQLAVVKLMKQWLTTHESWLLVLDNADDLRQLRPFLPTASGHILLTTRAQALGDIAQPLPVNQMAVDEGGLFLLRRSRVIGDDAALSAASETDQDLARTLTAEMDGLPLALDQAGAYIEEQMLSLEEYLELFQTEKAELLKERGQLDPDHPSVTVTFTLAFEKVATTNAISADLVRACAFLSPDAIPEEIFSEGAEAFGAPLSCLADSKLALTKAISEAARFSLISRNRQTKTLTIHRLVQEVLRGEMDRESQKGWAEAVMQAVTAVFPGAEYENWPQCDHLLPQSQQVAQLIGDYSLESETAALLLSCAGSYCYQLGRYGEAEPLLAEALGMYKRLLGDKHVDVAASLNHLALLYRAQGRYSEAKPLLVEALGLRRRLLGAEHADVATSLDNLAGLYDFQGSYSEAEPLYMEALGLRRRLLGAEHADVATSLNNLALFYGSQGRYGEAEPLYVEALEISKRLLGEEHPDVAISLHNLALLYSDQGRYEKAEPLYVEALKMYQRLLGAKHPHVATSLNNLAYLYVSQGRYSEAELLYREALEMRKRLLGDDHPDVAASLNDLARLYRAQGCYSEAEPLYVEALGMRKRLLGAEHPDVATSLNNLAGLYRTQGRYNEAEPLYVEALGMRKRLLGAEHPDVATSLNNLAGLYESQGRYSEAEPLYIEALEMKKQLLGEEHPAVATSLDNLAVLYASQGRYSEAEPLCIEALGMYKRLLGDKHPDVAACLDNLAGLYESQGRYSEAEPLYVEALELYKRLLGAEHPDVATSLNNLAYLYDSQGRYSEAEPLYVEALEMRKRLLGDAHPDVATSLWNLGAMRYSQQRFAEAEVLLLEALPIYQQALGAEHPATQNLLGWLDDVQTALDSEG